MFHGNLFPCRKGEGGADFLSGKPGVFAFEQVACFESHPLIEIFPRSKPLACIKPNSLQRHRLFYRGCNGSYRPQ